MKSFILLTLGFTLVAGTLSAQQPSTATNTPPNNSVAPVGIGPKHKHHRHPDFLAQINLSPSQKAQIAQIKKSTLDHKQKHKAIKALLTPDQRAQLKQLHRQWKAQQAH
jgi:Spy/CpxP family protein refolding chaperone